jgi:hypothetical protein
VIRKEDGKTSVDLQNIENMKTSDINDKSLIKEIAKEKDGNDGALFT